MRSDAARSCDKLDNATSLLDLALGVFAEKPRAHNDWNLGEATLTEDFAVAEREEVENRRGVGLPAGEVLLALLDWDEGP